MCSDQWGQMEFVPRHLEARYIQHEGLGAGTDLCAVMSISRLGVLATGKIGISISQKIASGILLI